MPEGALQPHEGGSGTMIIPRRPAPGIGFNPTRVDLEPSSAFQSPESSGASTPRGWIWNDPCPC